MKTAQMVVRHAIPLAIGAGCCWALYNQLSDIDFSTLWTSMQSVAAVQWLLALLSTAISFLAVARYDVVAHRHFQTGQDEARATATGATAIAVGQTIGAGAVVGALIRWRLIPQLGMVMAAQLTAFVTLTFLAAWAVVTAAAVLMLPSVQVPLSIPCSVIAVAGAVALFAFLNPVVRRSGHEVELPTLHAMAALLVLCLIDTLAAAAALWVLLPESFDLTLAQLFPIYLIALGAAILSGTPGGVGPFELTLLALLPSLPEGELIAAVLAFRLVYYAIPAAIGGIALLRPLARGEEQSNLNIYQDLDDTLQQKNARAELGVLRQNGGQVLQSNAGSCAVVRTGQTLTSMFDPLHAADDFTTHLRKVARRQNRIVCKYKISAAHAVRARKAGWSLLHVSNEAIVTTADYDLKGSSYRQLRRKLRNAEKAGLTVVEQTTGFPLADMARVAGCWEARNGGARGLSMGQFDEDYILFQRVFLAWKDQDLVGFITCHRTQHEWCLDLIRIAKHAPDGTAHLLVDAALRTAQDEESPYFSLAAAPALSENGGWLETKLRKLFFQKSGGAGLRQFKSCFAPKWTPLYMAAPGPTHLLIAAIDLLRAIKKPSAQRQRVLAEVPVHK